MCSKKVGGCFFDYLSLTNIVHLIFSTMKNVRSKQARDCFLVYSSLINIVHLKCSTTKKMCPKQAGRYL